MTNINFDRSGGATANDIHFELDVDNLSEVDAQNVRRLIDESGFFDLPENLTAKTSTDEFQYTISINAEDRSHTVHVSDSTMPNSLRPLIKELTMLKLLQS